MENFITIKIKPPVKNKLDTVRKNTHISEYIDQMLTFFEVTMVNPRDIQTYPLIEMKKDIQGLDRMLKGMEKGILNVILTGIRKIGTGQPTVVASPESVVKQPEVTPEMIIEVATVNQQLEENLAAEKQNSAKLSIEINRLNDELKKAPKVEKSNTPQYEELFKWLKSVLRKAPFNDDYVIAGPAYKEFINRLENLTQNK